jgi:hypothetical protein
MFVKVYFTVLHIVYVQINVREHQGAIKNGQTRKIKTKTQHNNSILNDKKYDTPWPEAS